MSNEFDPSNVSHFNLVPVDTLRKDHLKIRLDWTPLNAYLDENHSLKDRSDQLIESSYRFMASGRMIGASFVVAVCAQSPEVFIIGSGIAVMAYSFPLVINRITRHEGQCS